MNIYCIVSIILIFINIFFIVLKSNGSIHKFKDSLDTEQLIEYKSIYNERIYIYCLGIIIGIIIGYIYLYLYNDTHYKICKFIVIVCFVKFFVYYFYPKQKLMLYNLKDQEQVKLWADIYTDFKTNWKYSLILSIISYYLLFYGIIG